MSTCFLVDTTSSNRLCALVKRQVEKLEQSLGRCSKAAGRRYGLWDGQRCASGPHASRIRDLGAYGNCGNVDGQMDK